MKRIAFLFLFIVCFWHLAFSQWTEQTSGVTVGLNSVSAVTNSVAWTCGNSGRVLRTVNGGTNWLDATGTGIPASLALYNIFGIDSATALVTGSTTSSFVFKTTNGGTTWSQVFTQTGGFCDAIWMTSPLNGFMYGDPVGARWSLWSTVNGGLTWDSTGMYLAQAGSEAGYNNALYIVGTNIWFGTGGSKLYYSAASGLTGTWISQPTTLTDIFAVWFNTPPVGMSGGTQLLQTTNNGVAWSSETSPGSGSVTGITGIGANWWFTRLAPAVYATTNNGANWFTDYTAPAGNFQHIQRAITGTNIWAVRSNGGIAMSNGVLGIQQISTQVPGSYSLSQNYPNPFNPTTNFTFSIPKNSAVTIKIYDILGREAAVIANNEMKTAGTYKVDFNASSLASGIYFYTINAGNFTETKKMILVK